MKTHLILVIGALFLTCALGSQPASSPAPKGEDEAYPISLCFTPEMAYIPELGWDRCDPNEFTEHIDAVKARWQKICPWLSRHVTSEVARGLSRWARKQMQDYKAVPAMDKIEFKPVCRDQKTGMFVLEGTIDVLPVHAPTVRRWLKVYLLYEPGGKTIHRATITIRGLREE
jgi:hypothetical protein